MAYTPINWAENLDVTAVKLDKMDNQIDANENDLRGHDTDIASNDNDIADLLNFTNGIQWSSGRYNGNGRDNKIISVGFTPDIIVIAVSEFSYFYGSFQDDGYTGFLVTSSHPAGDEGGAGPITIINNGFDLGKGISHNNKNKYYQWVAVKLGN